MIILLFFGQTGVFVGPRWGQNEELEFFVVTAILEIKNTVLTCLLSNEGCDSFPKRLDLALAPNKTSEWVKKQ